MKVSVVVSCYNEEKGIREFYEATTGVLDSCSWDYELIFVNDGSVDDSLKCLRALADENSNVRVISLSRNFGHEAAMIAGIDHASGDGIVCMDADLQHPPECIPDILHAFEAGYEVVSMIRTSRADAGLLKRTTSSLFYRVLNSLSKIRFEDNSSDFFGFTRRAAHVLRTQYRERVRYLRGFVQSLGFKRTTLSFQAGRREYGKSHYSYISLISYSINTICGFSDVPLKIGIYSGLAAAFCGLILLIYSIVMKIRYDAPSGYTSIIVALCFLFSLTLIVIGIVGEYIAILMQEVKQRPIYIIDELIGYPEGGKVDE